MNEIWKIEKGWLAAYTEDFELMRRIQRYKDWRCVVTYSRKERLIGRQYKIPIEQRRSAERMFDVQISA